MFRVLRALNKGDSKLELPAATRVCFLMAELRVCLTQETRKLPAGFRMHLPRSGQSKLLCLSPRLVCGKHLVTPGILQPSPFVSFAEIEPHYAAPPALLAAAIADIFDALHGIHESGWSHGDVRPDNFGIEADALHSAISSCSQKFGMLRSTSPSQPADPRAPCVVGQVWGPAIVHARMAYFLDFGLSQSLVHRSGSERLKPFSGGTPSFYPTSYFVSWSKLMDSTLPHRTRIEDIAKNGDIFAVLMSAGALGAGRRSPTGFDRDPDGKYSALFKLGASFCAAVDALPAGQSLAFTKHLRTHQEDDCVSAEYHQSLCLPWTQAEQTEVATRTWVPEILQVIDDLSFTMFRRNGYDGMGAPQSFVRNPILTLAEARDTLRVIARKYHRAAYDDSDNCPHHAKRRKQA
jgi:hypothetical protein